MSQPTFQAPSGTRDLTEPVISDIRRLERVFFEEAQLRGFSEIEPPMFENAAVFERLGEASDVVSKELYRFEDRKGRVLALRPEFTASICRSYSQLRPSSPWKVSYAGPCFRYDRPQKGRYRQFYQVGVEAIGSDDPDIDVEVVALAARFYQRAGLEDVILRLNTLGDFTERPSYLAQLREYFESNMGSLSTQAQATLQVNPLRVLDSKRPGDAEIIAGAPTIIDNVSAGAAKAFDTVCEGLDRIGVTYEIDPRLVRGLDYYTRTTFEFSSPSLDAAQNAVGGGGRYDGLVAALGGPEDGGVGFGLGLDRTLLALEAAGLAGASVKGVQCWAVFADELGLREIPTLAAQLRAAGIATDRSFDGRSMKAQMRQANRSGARFAVIVGSDEIDRGVVALRDLTAGEQFEISSAQLVETIRDRLN